jgi:peptidoglycan/LPS O-acetylase OafA/YrhL
VLQPQIAERARFRYRADIDGLRAIAVVPVVLYHYRVAGFAGGFIGVDIFFVISGYLITALIFGEMQEGEFSILRFYERRARRILPALFAVIFASLAAGAALFFPRDLMNLAESAAATALFGSNFDFWLQSGYFDVSAELKPLLHSWSLAVEEQFYLVFPALLIAVHSRRRLTLLALVATLAIASFALSVWGVRHYPDAGFYLAPHRTWELMFGAMLALGKIELPYWRWLNESVAIIGLALIAWPIFTFTASTAFPGENAIYPCMGTALILLAGEKEGTLASRVLCWRPLVFAGLISYSLYLWHWPLYVFASYAKGSAIGAQESALLIAASLGLAVLSWRYVELPFRAGRHFLSRQALFRLAGAATAACMVVSGAVYASQGLPQRFPPNVQTILAEAFDAEPLRDRCFNRTPQEVERGDFCMIGDQSVVSPTFVLWGDSHADAILPAVEAAAAPAHRKGIFVGRGRCPPLLKIMLADEPNDLCARLNDHALMLAKGTTISVVILATRWAYYERGTGYGADQSDTDRLIDLSPKRGEDQAQHAVFQRALARTVHALVQAGKKVVLVAPIPEIGVAVPEAQARIALGRGENDVRPAASAYFARQAGVLATFDSLRRADGVTIIDPARSLCDSGRCAIAVEGKPLYMDYHHLSVFGARRLSPLFQGIF